MIEENRRPRFRFRIRTILLIVAVLALLLVVVIQQVQIGRMRQQIGQMKPMIDAIPKEREQLTTIIRELRDHLERSGSRSQ
jgi:predicted PurR-regulated permease PerM